jgi:Icc-related predicted phosphoesterase
MAQLKVLYATDIHGNTLVYEKLFEEAKKDSFKAIILGGDICPKSQRKDTNAAIQEQKDFLEKWLFPRIKELKQHLHLEVFMLTGNDDFRAIVPVFEKGEREGIIKFLNHNKYSIGDFFIVGYPFVNPTPFRLKDWEKGDFEPEHSEGLRTVPEGPQTTIEHDLQFLRKISEPEDTIYVIHAPPHGTKLDTTYGGQHVGSEAVKEFIEKENPYLTLHGHIHESPEVSGDFMEMHDETISVNPGSNHHKNKLNLVSIDLYNLADTKLRIV